MVSTGRLRREGAMKALSGRFTVGIRARAP